MTIRTLSVGDLQTNCYIVWDERRSAVVIDPGADSDAIRRVLEREQLTLGAILLTHVHFDHIGAVGDLTAPSVPVYCHRLEQPALTDGSLNLSAFFGAPVSPITDAVLLEDGDTVTVGELSFAVLHTPGHTVGSCCFLIGDVLFAGDTLFLESIGRTDFPGGNMSAMRASLSRLLALDGNIRVLSGHDAPTTIAHEQHYNPYIVR